MDKNDIELIKSSWGWVLLNRDKAGTLFYEKLFKAAPSVKHLFTTDVNEQQKKLIAAISFVVKNLDNFSKIEDKIKELGKKHNSYGAADAHYPVVLKH